MSAMGNLIFEIDEFLDPLVYMGASNKTILEQFESLYGKDERYSYMYEIVSKRIGQRQFLREG